MRDLERIKIAELAQRLQGQVFAISTALASNSHWTAETVAAQCMPLQEITDELGKLLTR